ncbi:MAG: SGNH/GDSL hydrolase family protein [Planctomycetota bacterium]
MESDPKRRRRTIRRRLAALALGLGVPLLVLEIGVRVVHGAPLPQKLPLQLVEADELSGWRFPPGRDFYTFDRLASINSLGLRGPEVGPKEEGELRIVALGDSLTFGVGVSDEETLPEQLRRELAARLGRPCTVVNTGHPAWATNQELACLLGLGPELHHDAVVLFWFFNDINEPSLAATTAELRESGPQTFETRNAFTGWPAVRWRIHEFLRRSAIYAYMDWQKDFRSHKDYSQDLVDRGMELLDDFYCDALHKLCERDGARPFVVVIPYSVSLGRDNACREIERRAAEIFRAHDFPVLETRDALERAARDLGRIPHVAYDYHYDAVGNRVQAEAVAAWLAEQLVE